MMMKKTRITALLLSLFLLLVLFACQPSQDPVASSPFFADSSVSTTEAPSVTSSANSSIIPLPSASLQAIFFDVGQGDCALILTDGHAMLVDAGNVGQDDLILGFLSKHGVDKLDYLVATHPHADHIGAMPAVIRNMGSIGTLLMPDVVHTTTIFEKLLNAIEERDVPVMVPAPGDQMVLGESIVTILAPVGTGYADLNNYSIVLHVQFGGVSILLTGDAEDISEAEQLAAGRTIAADVLKVGHHGANSSTNNAYLSAVSPRYAVISCSRDNQYGHPNKEIIDRLDGKDIAIYRTDEYGTVTVTTDGKTITIETERSLNPTNDVAASPSTYSENYIGNKNSKVFHIPACGSLPAEKNRIYFGNENDAVDQGFRPCQKCLSNG